MSDTAWGYAENIRDDWATVDQFIAEDDQQGFYEYLLGRGFDASQDDTVWDLFARWADCWLDVENHGMSGWAILETVGGPNARVWIASEQYQFIEVFWGSDHATRYLKAPNIAGWVLEFFGDPLESIRRGA